MIKAGQSAVFLWKEYFDKKKEKSLVRRSEKPKAPKIGVLSIELTGENDYGSAGFNNSTGEIFRRRF